MRYLPIAPPARRRPGAPGRPACSPARTRIAIGSSPKGTYHSSMTTAPMSPAAATSYLFAGTVNNRA
jgi:hypothetical protein